MLGHLVSNSAAPALHPHGPNSWFRRLIAFLLRRS
jgi:hypothetical protein